MSVTSEVKTYLDANPGSTGTQVRAGLSPTRKTHAVKHSIASLLILKLIRNTTPDTSTDFNQWDLNAYTSITSFTGGFSVDAELTV